MTVGKLLRDSRLWISVGSFLLMIFLILQFMPLPKENPPVTSPVTWDSPQTEQLARAACFDCHSNETHWYWYADVAPSRVLIRNDVKEGRDVLNFSQWNRALAPEAAAAIADEIEEAIQEGEMPPWYYRLIHAEAQLTDAQKLQLIFGLRQSLTRSLDAAPTPPPPPASPPQNPPAPAPIQTEDASR